MQATQNNSDFSLQNSLASRGSKDDFAPHIHPDLIIDTTEQEVFLLHPTEARWASTNRTGLAMARLLDGSRTLTQAAEELAAFYEIPTESTLEDLRRFTSQLYNCNLLLNAPLPKEKITKAPEPRIPSLTIYPTEQCNLRCKHCAIVEGKMPQTTLSTENICALIEEHTATYDNPTVAFLGGEPLLCPDILEMLEFATKRTRSVTICTNGLLVDDAMAKALGALPTTVQVSLDGADPEVHDFIRGKGTFAKAWSAVERLCQNGAAERLVIATTLTKCALVQVRDMIAKADALGIQTIRFLNLNKVRAATTNWDAIAPDPEELKAILHYLIFKIYDTDRTGKSEVRGSFPGFVPEVKPGDSHWCPLGETLIVDSQGNAFNCPVHSEPNFRVGNIHEDKIEEIIQGEKNTELRAQMLKRQDQIQECRECSWRNFCQGGCQAFTYHRTGSLWINDDFCDFRRDLYREHARRKVKKRNALLS